MILALMLLTLDNVLEGMSQKISIATHSNISVFSLVKEFPFNKCINYVICSGCYLARGSFTCVARYRGVIAV